MIASEAIALVQRRTDTALREIQARQRRLHELRQALYAKALTDIERVELENLLEQVNSFHAVELESGDTPTALEKILYP